MIENQKIRPAMVIGPLGEPLTLESLPAPTTTRWVVRRRGLVLPPCEPAPWWRTAGRSVKTTLQALALLALSFPLWWVPVLGTLVPVDAPRDIALRRNTP